MIGQSGTGMMESPHSQTDWEGQDEGDTHPNSNTSAWTGSGMFKKITNEAAA